MKYQKARSTIHQFQAAKEELAKRKEDLLKAELKVKDVSIEIVVAESNIKDLEKWIEEQNDGIKRLQEKIVECEDAKAAYVAQLRKLRDFVAKEPEELRLARQAVVTHKGRIVAQEGVVKRWAVGLGDAQKVVDDIKTRELLTRAAEDAALKQAKEGALKDLQAAQLAGKVPAEANLTEIVEKYFDRKRMFGR